MITQLSPSWSMRSKKPRARTAGPVKLCLEQLLGCVKYPYEGQMKLSSDRTTGSLVSPLQIKHPWKTMKKHGHKGKHPKGVRPSTHAIARTLRTLAELNSGTIPRRRRMGLISWLGSRTNDTCHDESRKCERFSALFEESDVSKLGALEPSLF